MDRCTGKIFRNIEQFSDSVCLIHNGELLTYREVLEQGDRLVPKGNIRELVFIEGVNNPASIAAYVSALRHGHVVHLLNPDKIETNKLLVSQFKPNRLVHFEGEQCRSQVLHTLPLNLHPELAVLLATSGSTGSSKLVKLSHANVYFNTRSIIKYLELSSKDVGVTTLKPHYSYGFSVINTHLEIGASLFVTTKTFQDKSIWQDIKRHCVTNFAGVPFTFQQLASSPPDWKNYTHLRFVTQAGGKLSDNLVKFFAQTGQMHGWSFFVMYGQTEAAPRMAYLPPENAFKYPSAIGIAIPDGFLSLVDEEGNEVSQPNVEGELVYRGPNVMMGYADQLAHLQDDETPERLMTGDMAIKNEAGLFIITGRRSRFAKLLGLRINLDDVENHIVNTYCPCAVITDDETLTVFCSKNPDDDFVASLASRYGVPRTTINVVQMNDIPRLSNGKTDYASLKLINLKRQKSTLRHLVRFGQSFSLEFFSILTGKSRAPESVRAAFANTFPNRSIAETDTFVSISGDSLQAIELSIALDAYFGFLPSKWQDQSIRELELRKKTIHV